MCRKSFDYRVWWRWERGGVAYRIVPDVLANTPDDAWTAGRRYSSVLAALAYIGRTFRGRVQYTIDIVPITAVDLAPHEQHDAYRVHEYQQEAATRLREHEADAIARVRAVEAGDGAPFPRDSRTSMPHGDPLATSHDNPYDGPIPRGF